MSADLSLIMHSPSLFHFCTTYSENFVFPRVTSSAKTAQFLLKNGKRRQIAPQQLIYLPCIPATPFLYTLQFPKRRGKTTNPEKRLFLRKKFGNISLKIFAGIFLLLAVCSTRNFAQLQGAVVGSVCLTYHFQSPLTIVISLWFLLLLYHQDIYMKQVPNPPFLGIGSAKKWSLFLDLGVQSPIFYT